MEIAAGKIFRQNVQNLDTEGEGHVNGRKWQNVALIVNEPKVSPLMKFH